VAAGLGTLVADTTTVLSCAVSLAWAPAVVLAARESAEVAKNTNGDLVYMVFV
jgi:hypothetical protein